MYRKIAIMSVLVLIPLSGCCAPSGFDGPRLPALSLTFSEAAIVEMPAERMTSETVSLSAMESGLAKGVGMDAPLDMRSRRDQIIEAMGLADFLPQFRGKFRIGHLAAGWKLRAHHDGRVELGLTGRF